MTQMRWLLSSVLVAASACTPFLGPPPDGGDSGANDRGTSPPGSDATTARPDSLDEPPERLAVDDGSVDRGGDGAARIDAAVQDSAAQEVALEAGAGPSVCGDGIPTPPEECDLGAGANTGAYGGCTKDCKLAPRCGDGKVNDASEVCDDGENNGFAIGNCNPACSGLVMQRTIRATDPLDESGIEDADLICQMMGPQYRAILVDNINRVASITPFAGDGEVDWVLLPYTRYVNAGGDLVWITDKVPLLAVRNGRTSALLNPVDPNVFYNFAWIGINTDWTTSSSTCNNWFSYQSADSGAALRLDTADFEIDARGCDMQRPMLCVERY